VLLPDVCECWLEDVGVEHGEAGLEEVAEGLQWGRSPVGRCGWRVINSSRHELHHYAPQVTDPDVEGFHGDPEFLTESLTRLEPVLARGITRDQSPLIGGEEFKHAEVQLVRLFLQSRFHGSMLTNCKTAVKGFCVIGASQQKSCSVGCSSREGRSAQRLGRQ